MKIEKIRFVATYNLLYNIHVFYVIRNYQSFVYINIVLQYLGGICNEGRVLQQGCARGPRPAAKTCGARTDLGSSRLGNCTFGKLPFGKISLGSCHLEKCLRECTITSF